MERVTTRGRPKGSRGRGKGKRGRKPKQIVSDEEENHTETLAIKEQEDPVVSNNENVVVNQEDPEIISATENKSPAPEIITADGDVSMSEVDHEDELVLDAPSFTTVQRNVPQVMLKLNWDHKVNLIGEKILNPMIYCCDQCEKPILVYGRMIPCRHVFCLGCAARTEAVSKQCPRCKDKVSRVEETRLGTVFMCTHGGTRYGSAGCRRTYLSQRDLQAHIDHRHALTDRQLLSTAASIEQQPSSNNSHIRKDSLNSSSATSLFPSSRTNNDNNHQHSHYQQQQQQQQQQQLTPTKIKMTKSYLSQDNNIHGSYYNNQFGGGNGSGGGNNNFGAGSSSTTQNSNNFYQQQSYHQHHQNFNNNYSQQGQHQPPNQHHQSQQNWNQQYSNQYR